MSVWINSPLLITCPSRSPLLAAIRAPITSSPNIRDEAQPPCSSPPRVSSSAARRLHDAVERQVIDDDDSRHLRAHAASRGRRAKRLPSSSWKIDHQPKLSSTGG